MSDKGQESSYYNKDDHSSAQSNGKPNADLMNALEVSRILRIPLSTIYHLTQLGKINAVRIGKHWRYHRHDIEKYLQGDNSEFKILNSKLDQNHSTFNIQNSKFNGQSRRASRINTHLPCEFEIFIPGWKKMTGHAAIRKISEQGVYLRKIELDNGHVIEPDDPILLRFDLVGEIEGRVIRLDRDPVQGGENGPLGVAILFRHLSDEVKRKIRDYVG